MKNPWNTYRDNLTKQLTKRQVDVTTKAFMKVRTIGLLGGVTLGAVFAFLQYNAYHLLLPSTVIGVAFSIIGYLAPNVWVNHLSKKRKHALEAQLEETLTLIKEKMETEKDLMKVVRRVAEENKTPFAADLKRIHVSYTLQDKHIAFEDLKKELKKNA